MSELKTVLITGGSSGIGYAIARRFVEENYITIITGRQQEKLHRAVESLGTNCEGIPFDMDWIDDIPKFVGDLYKKYRRLDVLVNNAGINQKKPFLEVTNKEFENIIKINQTALFSMTREVAGYMIKQKPNGVIIHISSMAAHYGIPQVISYTASKSALEGMTRAMAVELSPQGIRVNCVSPGFINTEMSSKALSHDPERKIKVLSRTPLGKLGEPGDIANAVYFLASDEASFITGETLKVDGGNSIGF